MTRAAFNRVAMALALVALVGVAESAVQSPEEAEAEEVPPRIPNHNRRSNA